MNNARFSWQPHQFRDIAGASCIWSSLGNFRALILASENLLCSGVGLVPRAVFMRVSASRCQAGRGRRPCSGYVLQAHSPGLMRDFSTPNLGLAMPCCLSGAPALVSHKLWFPFFPSCPLLHPQPALLWIQCLHSTCQSLLYSATQLKPFSLSASSCSH